MTLGAFVIAALVMIAGCSSKEERIVQVPTPPPQIIVQPAPVIMAAPQKTMTERTTTERSVNDAVDNSPGDTAQDRSSSYHSETTTVTPIAPPVSATTTTTYQKKTYDSNY